MLFPSGLVIDASGEGTIEAGISKFATFILVVAILGWQIWVIILTLGEVTISLGSNNLCL